MGRSSPYAVPEFLDGNHYPPVNVVHSDREISQRPGTDGSHTSDNLLASILHSRSMTHASLLELRRAILCVRGLKAEGGINPAEAERTSVLLRTILCFWELKAEGRISSVETERASVLLLWSCLNAQLSIVPVVVSN